MSVEARPPNGREIGYRLGIDVGGTFTDFVLMRPTGDLMEEKVPSRPHAPGEALREGIERLSRDLGYSPCDLLKECDVVVHGTTVATNAVIQGRVARTGLICTEGFRDALALREGYKEDRYDLGYPHPPVMVARHLRLSVSERISSDGEVLLSLNEHDVREKIAVLKHAGVQAVAVCLLWSVRNPAHELRVGELARSELSAAYISTSLEILPEVRYYDRLSTTVMNAALGPVVVPYVEMIEQELLELGYRGPIRFMQSNGGLISAAGLKRRPILALHSGPAAAPAAGTFFAKRMASTTDVLTLDMGGTSFDVCAVEGGAPRMTKNVDVHRYRVGIAMVEVNTVGAGGGSIAALDAGLLRVGPESAEATPGPACYGRGGAQPTVCDADVILGYLNPVALLGGRFPIHQAAAKAAIDDRISTPLGLTDHGAAWAIVGLVNHTMADAIREMSVERGRDPRDFTIVAAGGCGPMHAAAIAQELGIRHVVIPRVASTFCAFGAAVADLRYDHSKGYLARFGAIDRKKLDVILAELEEEVKHNLEEDGVPESNRVVHRSVDMRYVGQTHECNIELPDQPASVAMLNHIRDRFDAEHKALFTYSEPESEVEVVTVRVTGIGRRGATDSWKNEGLEESRSGKVPESESIRPVVFQGEMPPVETRVFQADKFTGPVVVDGPAIVEERNTVIVVPPGARVQYNGRDAYLLTLLEAESVTTDAAALNKGVREKLRDGDC